MNSLTTTLTIILVLLILGCHISEVQNRSLEQLEIEQIRLSRFLETPQ